MFIDKKALEFAQRFVGKDHYREILNGVAIEANQLTGTNGKILGSIECGDDTESPLSPCVIGIEDCKALTKAMPRDGEIKVSEGNTDQKTLCAQTTKSGLTQTAEIKPLKGDYPPWRRLVPQGDPKARVWLNPGFLEQVAMAFKQLRYRIPITGDHEPVCVEIYGEKDPVKITITDPITHQTAIALIMPVSVERKG